MSKGNKPEISTYEKLERIESRLKELSDIQKYLFDKYLEVAESDPVYQERLHGLVKEIRGIEIPNSYGTEASIEEMKAKLEIEERKVKIERLQLENQQLQLHLTQAANGKTTQTLAPRTGNLRSFKNLKLKKEEKKPTLMTNLVKHGSFIAVMSVLIIGIYLISFNNRWGYLLTVFAANLLAFRKFTLKFLNLEMSDETKN